MAIAYAILLGAAVSIDAFIAGLAYGIKGITISTQSLIVVGLLTGFCTLLPMPLAYYLGQTVTLNWAKFFGMSILLILGLWSIFQEYATKTLLKISFSIGRLIVNIMVKPESVDIDGSKTISLSEAALLGLALGLDNAVATFAACLLCKLTLFTPMIMAILQMLLIYLGIHVTSKIIPSSFRIYFSYIPGLTLILLGLIRLLLG